MTHGMLKALFGSSAPAPASALISSEDLVVSPVQAVEKEIPVMTPTVTPVTPTKSSGGGAGNGFLNILKKIGTIFVGVEHVAAPIASTLLPQYAGLIGKVDDLVGHVQDSIQTAEVNHPLDGQGQIKLAAVNNDVQSFLSTTQSVLAMRGETLQYDQDLFNQAVSAQVTAYNAFSKWKDSFKIVVLTPTP